MRALLLSLLIGWFQTTVLLAQTNYLDNNPSWRVNSSCQVGLPCILHNNYMYYVNGDTTIGSEQYKKLFITGNSVYDWQSSPPAAPGCSGTGNYDSLYTFIRQDSMKLFRWFAFGDELLYDFDLEVGDTLPITLLNALPDLVVDSIDTVWLGSEPRRRFHYNGSFNSYIIEGIGSPHGFLETMMIVLECGYNLECYAEQDSVLYSMWGACDLMVSAGEQDQGTLKIYPNPASHLLFIESNEPVWWFMVDVLGRTVQSGIHPVQAERFEIPVEGLPTGLYSLSIRSKRGDLKCISFIKE